MGRAYKKNIKNQYGKPDITAHDTLPLGATLAEGTASLTDAQGISVHPSVRGARLEGASVVISSGLTGARSIGVSLTVNSATVASGTLSAGDNYLDLILDKADDEEVTLSAGDNISLIYNAALLGSTGTTISGRVHKSLLE